MPHALAHLPTHEIAGLDGKVFFGLAFAANLRCVHPIYPDGRSDGNAGPWLRIDGERVAVINAHHAGRDGAGDGVRGESDIRRSREQDDENRNSAHGWRTLPPFASARTAKTLRILLRHAHAGREEGYPRPVSVSHRTGALEAQIT